MASPVLIVGGGQAGVQLCMALRREKYDGPISLYCAEADYPYHRPPLSKSYVTGETSDDKLPMRPESFYEKNEVDLHLGVTVSGIDPSSQQVVAGETSDTYESLVLATGARPRLLDWQHDAPAGVYALRDLADARLIRQGLADCRSLVIVGAGFIGLELATAAAAKGVAVTVFETADRVMGRAVAPLISSWFEQTHRAAGIDIRLGTSVSGIEQQQGAVSAVHCADGSALAADMVVVGIGVLPNIELAETAGLDCDGGIWVDEFCRTSVPSIYAAGDCAAHENRFADGRRLRLESIQNAADQARTIAASIAGTPKPYSAVPWFWSDQGPHKLQMTGLSFDADHYIQRGEPDAGRFSVFHYRGDRLLAVDSVNESRDHMVARKLIEGAVSPTREQAGDVGFDLKSLIS
jgi:3-phenylpropionate/trans-cinnamate dioxygenase ferredoxin reductase subunit